MKRPSWLIGVILAVFVGPAMAQYATTPNLGLKKPTISTQRYGLTDPNNPAALINENLDILDAAISVNELMESTVAALPNCEAATKNQLRHVTDNIRGIWICDGTAWRSLTGYADVRDWGAIGDGTTAGGGTDDTAAFVAATAAVPPGGMLYIPPVAEGKCYRLTDNWSVTTNGIHIRGGGWTFRQASSWALSGSVICQTGSGKIALDLGAGTANVEQNGISVENIAIGGTSGTLYAVRQRAVNRSYFNNIYIAGAGTTGWYMDGGTTDTQNILNKYDHIFLSTAFGTAQGFAKPTTGFALYSGPNEWHSLHISGIDTPTTGVCLDLDGPSADGEGNVFTGLSTENCTINVRFGANSLENVFLNTYAEGSGTISGTVTAGNRSNLSIGNVASGLHLPATVGVNMRGYQGRMLLDNTSLLGGDGELAPFTTAGTVYGGIHGSKTSVTNVWNTSATEGGVPIFGHTNTSLADVTMAEFHATGALADSTLKIGSSSANLGDIGFAAYKRSTGAARNIYLKRFATDVIATGSLPAAAASEDGRIIIEDAGTGDRNIIIYAGGQRFRIDGGTAF